MNLSTAERRARKPDRATEGGAKKSINELNEIIRDYDN